MTFTWLQSRGGNVITVFFEPQHSLKEVEIIDWNKTCNSRSKEVFCVENSYKSGHFFTCKYSTSSNTETA